jgi:hypothetical protein
VGAFFDENAARFVEDLLKRKVPNWKSMNVTELVTLLKKTLTGQGKDTQTDGPTRLMSQIIALKPPFRMFAADLETTRAWVNSVAKLVDTKTDGYDASRWTQEMNESFFTTLYTWLGTQNKRGEHTDLPHLVRTLIDKNYLGKDKTPPIDEDFIPQEMRVVT